MSPHRYKQIDEEIMDIYIIPQNIYYKEENRVSKVGEPGRYHFI